MAQSKFIVAFDKLSEKEKMRIHSKMVAFLTNPSTKQCMTKVSPYLIQQAGLVHPWLQIHSWDDRVVYSNRITSMVQFDRLPRDIELLLGITHREFFEEYKKAIQIS